MTTPTHTASIRAERFSRTDNYAWLWIYIHDAAGAYVSCTLVDSYSVEDIFDGLHTAQRWARKIVRALQDCGIDAVDTRTATMMPRSTD